jgi:hypothetical protein
MKSKIFFCFSSLDIYLFIDPIPGLVLGSLDEFCGGTQAVFDGGENGCSV